ncbi:MAG TPA: glycosyltransferase [Gemmataceae bacterium]|nr:glycosyltransferase [Gemmataceae bacterium]
MPEFPSLPPVATEPVSVVLSAHNEETHLEEVLGRWIGFLNGLGRAYEVLLVDDGSTDRTVERAEQLAARHPRVRLLRHPIRQGEGAALRTGVAAAEHPLLAHAPCDLRFRPEELKKLLAEIDKVHLVSGFRVCRPVPGWLRGLGRLYRGLARWLFAVSIEPLPGWLGWREHVRRYVARALFGVRLRDVGCPFRLFRRSVFARLPIQSDGPFAHVEVLAKANFLGHIMTEVPVTYQPRPDERAARWSFAEVRRVFSAPDFGPPVLPEPGQAAQPPETGPGPQGGLEA